MLKIYNTPKRRKEVFIPTSSERVTMYNCGLTVYEKAHIGNLRAYTMADIIRRSLEFLGYKVIQVQNFTDVGHETLTEEQKSKIKSDIEITDTDCGIDRLEKTAKKTGLTVWEVAEFYIKEALKDFNEMNFLEPHYRPRATEHIPEQIDLIKKLLKKGFAYFTNSAIYYDISKFERYWDFAGQKPEEKKIGVREELEIDPEKKNPYDFRLWQFNRPDHTMQWDFWWEGKNYRGYPGWHIECSAMAHKYLGNPIDIHTGGIDHIQIHHPNEIAQSEPIYGKPFVKYWYHNAFITVDGKKMGKSLGNAYNLDEIKNKGYHALDLRYFYLTADFRKPQNFTWDALESARKARLRLLKYIEETKNKINLTPNNTANQTFFLESEKTNKYFIKFKDSIEDSFNIPLALAVLWDLIDDTDLQLEHKLYLISRFDTVFGLKLMDLQEKDEEIIDETTLKKLNTIIELREKARRKRNYKEADKLRAEAQQLGFDLIDTKDGTRFQKRRLK